VIAGFLSSLFKSDAQWKTAFKKWEAGIPRYAQFAGRLADARSAGRLLEFDLQFDRARRAVGSTRISKRPKTRPPCLSAMMGRISTPPSLAGQAELHPPGDHGDPGCKDEDVSGASELAPHRLTLGAAAALQAAHA